MFATLFLLIIIGLTHPPLFAQDIGLLVSPGKLSKVHAAYAGVDNCTRCHTEGKKTDTAKCLDCHKDLSARITAGTGFHKDKSEECISCHPEHHGEDFKLIEFDSKSFDHNTTGYPLTGLHQPVKDCRRCHQPPNAPARKLSFSYLLNDTRCIGCHKDVHSGQLGESCQQCHNVETKFQQAKTAFDHNKAAFTLKGRHQTVNCLKCHKAKPGTKVIQWKGLAFNRCSYCHTDPHKPSFNQACSRCHNETSWREVSSFDHNRTRYPLTGKHRSLACSRCHPPGQKHKKMPFGKCTDCHRRDPHKGQFKQDCSACHSVTGFNKVALDHDNTRYPLTGKHRSVTCRKCHKAAAHTKTIIYKPLETACAACHRDIHLGQLKGTCDQCHVTKGFKRPFLQFDHNTGSKYPLRGKHAAATCEKCHHKTSGNFPKGPGQTVRYLPLSTKCADCHDDFHRGQLGNNCETCHLDYNSFTRIEPFDHSRTRFKLDTIHEQVACSKCHPRITITQQGKAVETIKFKPIGTACLDCHRDYDHSRAAFKLSGKHKNLDCQRCHTVKTPYTRRLRPVARGLFQCRHCHRSPHPGDQPNCVQCHNTQSWRVDSWR